MITRKELAERLERNRAVIQTLVNRHNGIESDLVEISRKLDLLLPQPDSDESVLMRLKEARAKVAEDIATLPSRTYYAGDTWRHDLVHALNSLQSIEDEIRFREEALKT